MNQENKSAALIPRTFAKPQGKETIDAFFYKFQSWFTLLFTAELETDVRYSERIDIVEAFRQVTQVKCTGVMINELLVHIPHNGIFHHPVHHILRPVGLESGQEKFLVFYNNEIRFISNWVDNGDVYDSLIDLSDDFIAYFNAEKTFISKNNKSHRSFRAFYDEFEDKIKPIYNPKSKPTFGWEMSTENYTLTK